MPELKAVAPLGMLVEVTVCAATSLLVQITVLFAPTTTVVVVRPVPERGLVGPDPFRMEIGEPVRRRGTLDVEVLAVLDRDGRRRGAGSPDPATTTIVPTIVVGWTSQ